MVTETDDAEGELLSPDDLLIVFGAVAQLGVGLDAVRDRYGPQAAFKLKNSLLEICVQHAAGLRVTKWFRYPSGTPTPTLGREWQLFPHERAGEGELVTRALAEAFDKGFKRVVLFYADCPSLVEEFLDLAFETLDEGGAQIVLGPTPRGGLYLVGAQRAGRELFAGLPWKSSHLWETATERAKQRGLKFAVLPKKEAVELPEDWIRVAAEGWIPPPPAVSGGTGRKEG